MVLVRLYQRTSSSYDVALSRYQDRVAAGEQPSTNLVDLFNVATEEVVLLSTNFCYLLLVILLYLQMLVSRCTRTKLWKRCNTLYMCTSKVE